MLMYNVYNTCHILFILRHASVYILISLKLIGGMKFVMAIVVVINILVTPISCSHDVRLWDGCGSTGRCYG